MYCAGFQKSLQTIFSCHDKALFKADKGHPILGMSALLAVSLFYDQFMVPYAVSAKLQTHCAKKVVRLLLESFCSFPKLQHPTGTAH